MRCTSQFVIKITAIALLTCLLLAFISTQYAKAVGSHKLAGAFISGERHKVSKLLKASYFKGDMVNSFQSSQFSVTILCPQELALLIKQIARAIYLTGFVAGLYAVASGYLSFKNKKTGALRQLVNGATTFGFTAFVPDLICSLAKWSNGYAPF